MSTLDELWGSLTGLFKTNNAIDLSKILGGASGIASLLAAMNQEAPETALKQQQLGLTTGTSTGTSAGTTSQTQNQTQAQTSETTLPQWYLDLVKQQATGATQLKEMDPFGKTMLDMDVNAYMNPYLTQVSDPVMRRLGEDQARQQQDLAAQRVSRGAFGTGRADLLQNQMMERQALERTNTLGDMYSKAFGNAQNTAGTDLSRQFQEWQTMQQDPRQLASTQANILSTLKPGQITTSTGNLMGTTAGTTTGTTTGTTAGTSQTNVDAVQTGAEPNKMGALANLFGTWATPAKPPATTTPATA